MNNNPLIMQRLLANMQGTAPINLNIDPGEVLAQKLALYVGSPGSVDNPNMKQNLSPREYANLLDRNRLYLDGVENRNQLIQDYGKALDLYRNGQQEENDLNYNLLSYNTPTGQGLLQGYPMTYATNYFDGSIDKNLLVPKRGAISDAKGYEDEAKKYRVEQFNAAYMNLNNQNRGK